GWRHRCGRLWYFTRMIRGHFLFAFAAGFGLVLGSGSAPAQTPTPPGDAAALYAATVPLAERSDNGRAVAFQIALRQVLTQMTGRPGGADEPALAALIPDAARFVQRYRMLPDGQISVGFDGSALEKKLAAADPQGMREVMLTVAGVAELGAY